MAAGVLTCRGRRRGGWRAASRRGRPGGQWRGKVLSRASFHRNASSGWSAASRRARPGGRRDSAGARAPQAAKQTPAGTSPARPNTSPDNVGGLHQVYHVSERTDPSIMSMKSECRESPRRRRKPRHSRTPPALHADAKRSRHPALRERRGRLEGAQTLPGTRTSTGRHSCSDLLPPPKSPPPVTARRKAPALGACADRTAPARVEASPLHWPAAAAYFAIPFMHGAPALPCAPLPPPPSAASPPPPPPPPPAAGREGGTSRRRRPPRAATAV